MIHGAVSLFLTDTHVFPFYWSPKKNEELYNSYYQIVYDLITKGKIDLIINSPIGKDSKNDDSYLRKAAIKAKVPYMTTIAAAKATAAGIHYVKTHEENEIKSLQTLHSEITDK